MALTDTGIRFLFFSKSQGVSFTESLTIGRLESMINPLLLKELSIKHQVINETGNVYKASKEKYIESILQLLGAKITDSLDFSNFEGASIIHDMNYAIPDSYKKKYSVIIDGGSLEHVFNFPMAIRNCMDMIRKDGHFISFAPLNNQMGHGFYQFSPELFYRIFSIENGFSIKAMYMVAAECFVDTDKWYSVKDPKEIKERIILSNSKPTYILLLAQKIKDVIPFVTYPNQSDYVEAWKNANKNVVYEENSTSNIKLLYRKIVGENIRLKIRRFYNNVIRDFAKKQNLEKVNKKYFTKHKI